MAQLEIDEPISAVRRALKALPAVDVKVLVYHGGFERDLQSGALLSATGENQACEFCREFDFDVLLAGHQHIPVESADICGTHAVQPASNGKCLACVEVEMEEGRPPQVISRLLPPAPTPLKSAFKALQPIETAVQAWLDRPAGHLDVPLVAQNPLERAINGSLLANFVNAVQLWASGAEISACSLPNEFKGMGENVTVRDVVSTYVYANTLKVLRITGRDLRAYVERTAAYFAVENGRVAVSSRFLRPKVEHYNYDFFSGMDYVIDLRRPEGSRVAALRRYYFAEFGERAPAWARDRRRRGAPPVRQQLPRLRHGRLRHAAGVAPGKGHTAGRFRAHHPLYRRKARYLRGQARLPYGHPPRCPGRRRAVTPVKGGRCALCPPREGYTASRRGQSRRRHMARAFFAPLAPSSIVHKRQKIPQMILPGCVDFPMNF